MSKTTSILQTRNQQIANYDISKLQLGDNEHVTGDYTAAADVTLDQGLLLGKVAATGALVALAPTAADGSQFPYGILFLGLSEDIDIANGATETLTLINKGRVALDKLVMPAGVTLADVITGDGRTVQDYLNAMGFILEGSIELTQTDNQ